MIRIIKKLSLLLLIIGFIKNLQCKGAFIVSTTTKTQQHQVVKYSSFSFPAPPPPHHHRRQINTIINDRKSFSKLDSGASDLSTAYEWLADEKELDLEWLNPASVIDNQSCDEYNDDTGYHHIQCMPLYPLEACYIPVLIDKDKENIDEIDYVFLRNVEPRNVKMALDMIEEMKEKVSAKFCAVLKAVDTGCIATVGTILEIVDFDEQFLWDGKTIARIVLKCIPVERVKILKVLNPNAWSRENRLLQLDEYLKANVALFKNDLESTQFHDDDVSCILMEYEAVKNIYETNDIVTKSFPPFAIEAISNLPQMNIITDEKSFWNAARVWQLLCFTIKEANRVNLQSIIDEKTISAAIQKGGPLNLPIHREELPFDVRIELNSLEETAAKRFIGIEMEPCLNFQHLLATRNLSTRISLLKEMIVNERLRLEGEIMSG